MAGEHVRGDAIREWLTGAASDGGAQASPAASLGGFRSSTEANTYAISTAGLTGVSILHGSGVAQSGTGSLQAVDANTLRWRPPGNTQYGPPASFSGTGVVGIVEGPDDAGQHLRVSATTPFTPGVVPVTLSIGNTVFSFPDVQAGDALAGISHYRASMLKNDSASTATACKRWIGTLGTARLTNSAQLGAAGPGTITTSGSLADWPLSGWAQIHTAGGAHRETVYYSYRTSTSLNVIARGCLGTTPAAGAGSDIMYPVPGIALAIDPAGAQTAGTGMETIADQLTAPAGVAWVQGITPATGLQIGNIGAGQEVGIWIWREIPPGSVAQAAGMNRVLDSYNAY